MLDDDTIEDQLRKDGVLSDGDKKGALKADFGSWTTQEDTDNALSEARKVRSDTYNDTFGPQQVGKVVQVSTTLGVTDDAPSSWLVKIPGTRWDWPVDVTITPSDIMSRMPPKLGDCVRITGYNATTHRLAGVGPV